MQSNGLGRRSSTIPVRVSALEREDKSATRTDPRKTQTLKSKGSNFSSDGNHVSRIARASSSDRASKGAIFKATGKTSLSKYAPTTPVTPAGKQYHLSAPSTAPGSINRLHAGLPTGSRSASKERISSIGGQRPRKDTRPLTDKSYQALMLNTIDNFFANHSLSTMLNANGSLKPITLKMFVTVSDHLVKMLDIKQILNINNYVEELPKIAKKLHYPGAITKSWLKTANAMHSWPSVLGWISWLVKINEIKAFAQITFNLEALPFEGSEQQANRHKNVFLLMLNAYKAWNDEKTEEEKKYFDNYLKDIQDKEGVNEYDLENARALLEADQLKLQAAEAKSNKVEKEIRTLREKLETLKNYDEDLDRSIHVKKEQVQSVIFKIEQMDSECDVMLKQIPIQESQYEKMVMIIKEQPMSKAEQDKKMKECLEIENYVQCLDEYMQDLQNEMYKMDIKLASTLNDVQKKIMAYNKNLFMNVKDDIGVDIENLKLLEEGILRTDVMEELNTKVTLLNEVQRHLKNKLTEQRRLNEINANEVMKLQENSKGIEDQKKEEADKLKERKAYLKKIKNDFKSEEAKLKEQLKNLQDECKEIEESIPDLQGIMAEVEELRDKLNAVAMKKEYITENAKMFFKKFYGYLEEHRSELYMILTQNKETEFK